MNPEKVATELRRLASILDKSVAPSRDKISTYLRHIIAKITTRQYLCSTPECNGLSIKLHQENTSTQAKCPSCNNSLKASEKEIEKITSDSKLRETLQGPEYEYECENCLKNNEKSLVFFSSYKLDTPKCPLCRKKVTQTTSKATSREKQEFIKPSSEENL